MSHLILFAGGGTGGHLFPGIALAEALRADDPQTRVLFVGSERAVERTIMAEHGHRHVALPLSPLQHLWRQPGRFLWRNCRAVTQASQLIRCERPRAVIGLGGLTSAPTVWAAHRARIPVLLLEQNALPGRATRWLAACARVICTSFAECIDHLPKSVPALTCGNPVRADIARLLHEPANRDGKTLLVLGGSQGAESLNAAVCELVRRHRDRLADWTVVHQTGPRQVEASRAAYASLGQSNTVAAFFPNMAEQYRQAEIVISRAGATTLAELACAGKPMVLLPYPQAADDHQRANAESFVRHGAAALVRQLSSTEQTADNLWTVLEPWLNNAALRQQIGHAARTLARPDAAERILALLHDAVRTAA